MEELKVPKGYKHPSRRVNSGREADRPLSPAAPVPPVKLIDLPIATIEYPIDEEAHEENLRALISVQKERLKRHYRTDLFDFAKFCLGYDWLEDEVHRPLCQILMDIYYGKTKGKEAQNLLRFLILMWRGSLKTTIISVAFPIWILVQNDPPHARTSDWEPPQSFNRKKGYDQRILLGQEIDKNVIKYHKTIQGHFEKNPNLINIFGELAPSKRVKGTWTNFQSNVTWRQDIKAKEANITCCSLEGSINSGHYDLALMDDICSDKQMNNVEQIEKVHRFLALLMPIMEIALKEDDAMEDRAGSVLVWSGVRWDDNDPAGLIKREQAHLWHIWECPVYRDIVVGGQDVRVYAWPRRFGEAQVNELRSSMPPDEFAKHYLLDPIDRATAVFRDDYFSDDTLFTLASDPLHRREFLRDMSVYVVSDPAVSKEKHGCYAAILTVGVDRKGHFWILDAFRKKGVQPTDFINEAVRQWQEWGAVLIGVEEEGIGKIYQPFMDLMAATSDAHLPPLWPLKTNQRSKDYRIMGLEPYARAKRIHLQRRNPVHLEIREEFLRFRPQKGSIRDAIDAAAYIVDLVRVPVTKLMEEVKKTDGLVSDDEARELWREMRRGMGLEPGHRKLPKWYN